MIRRHGFSVMEVLVGLVVGALVLAIAGRVLSQTRDASRAVIRSRAALDIDVLRRRRLASVFRSLQVGIGDDDSFRGTERSLEFTARRQTVNGWFEAKRLLLRLDQGRVVLGPPVSEDMAVTRSHVDVVADDVDALELHYLQSFGATSEWLRGWSSPATAPTAVRVIVRHTLRRSARVQADTQLYVIGSRG